MKDFELYCLDAAIELTYECSELIEEMPVGLAFSAIEEVVRKHAYAWAKVFYELRCGDKDPLWDEVGERFIQQAKEDLIGLPLR